MRGDGVKGYLNWNLKKRGAYLGMRQSVFHFRFFRSLFPKLSKPHHAVPYLMFSCLPHSDRATQRLRLLESRLAELRSGAKSAQASRAKESKASDTRGAASGSSTRSSNDRRGAAGNYVPPHKRPRPPSGNTASQDAKRREVEDELARLKRDMGL